MISSDSLTGEEMSKGSSWVVKEELEWVVGERESVEQVWWR